MEQEKVAKYAGTVAKSLKNILYKKPSKPQPEEGAGEQPEVVVPDDIEDTFDRDEIYPLW